MKILLLEDNRELRLILAEALFEVGHEVIEADNFEDGLLLVFEGGFDILLTDLILPGGTGKDVAELCRMTNKDSKIGIMTGDLTSLSLGSELEVAHKVFAKPFNLIDLIEWCGSPNAVGIDLGFNGEETL